jgi:hypothetical protein
MTRKRLVVMGFLVTCALSCSQKGQKMQTIQQLIDSEGKPVLLADDASITDGVLTLSNPIVISLDAKSYPDFRGKFVLVARNPLVHRAVYVLLSGYLATPEAFRLPPMANPPVDFIEEDLLLVMVNDREVVTERKSEALQEIAIKTR